MVLYCKRVSVLENLWHCQALPTVASANLLANTTCSWNLIASRSGDKIGTSTVSDTSHSIVGAIFLGASMESKNRADRPTFVGCTP